MPGARRLAGPVAIRAVSRVPVIMLTARADEPDVLRGFAGGADNYVTKPLGSRSWRLARTPCLIAPRGTGRVDRVRAAGRATWRWTSIATGSSAAANRWS